MTFTANWTFFCEEWFITEFIRLAVEAHKGAAMRHAAAMSNSFLPSPLSIYGYVSRNANDFQVVDGACLDNANEGHTMKLETTRKDHYEDSVF